MPPPRGFRPVNERNPCEALMNNSLLGSAWVRFLRLGVGDELEDNDHVLRVNRHRHSIFRNKESSKHYPPTIMGTAASAASNPTNLQRVRCSFRNRRASRTVTAG
jgi:hypothetical protein